MPARNWITVSLTVDLGSMEGKAKSVMLASLKRALDTHPQVWDNYKKLGETVLNCTEFFHEKTLVLQSQALAKSRLNIEIILLEENLPSLLEDFRTMTGILDQIQQLQTESSKEINNVILITSEFLLAMEEAEA
mgnify:CR=1 FL=1